MSMNRRRGGAEEADAEAEAEADVDMPRAVKGEEMSVGRRDASEEGAATRGRTEPAATTGTRARRVIELRTNAARIRSAEFRANATRGTSRPTMMT